MARAKRFGRSAHWLRSKRLPRRPVAASPSSNCSRPTAPGRRCTSTTIEDEWFYVTEGELTFWVGGRTIRAPAGAFVYGPRDIPHTFLVSSPQARFGDRA